MRKREVTRFSFSDLSLFAIFQLLEKLYEVFGSQWYFKKFAVRSSAVGEDSEEMSAAGQMTTFLGMRGERKIASAIVECWASQFALTGMYSGNESHAAVSLLRNAAPWPMIPVNFMDYIFLSLCTR